MTANLRALINSYNPSDPIDHAFTIPSSWYTNKDLYELELQTVFTNSWQLAARRDQLEQPGNFVTTNIGTEPIVVVRGNDNVLRGFFNVCRHHAAAVMTEAEGTAPQLRCPYHGWTYSLAGELKGTPDFTGVCNFERENNGLVSVSTAEWENWVFVRPATEGKALQEFLSERLIDE